MDTACRSRPTVPRSLAPTCHVCDNPSAYAHFGPAPSLHSLPRSFTGASTAVLNASFLMCEPIDTTFHTVDNLATATLAVTELSGGSTVTIPRTAQFPNSSVFWDTCGDGRQNGNESDTDCGGRFCAARCPRNSSCTSESDCAAPWKCVPQQNNANICTVAPGPLSIPNSRFTVWPNGGGRRHFHDSNCKELDHRGSLLALATTAKVLAMVRKLTGTSNCTVYSPSRRLRHIHRNLWKRWVHTGLAARAPHILLAVDPRQHQQSRRVSALRLPCGRWLPVLVPQCFSDGDHLGPEPNNSSSNEQP